MTPTLNRPDYPNAARREIKAASSSAAQLSATLREGRAGITGLGDGPADHQLTGPSRNRFLGPHHAGLIAGSCPFRANARRDQSKRLGVLTAQGRSLKW